MSDENEGQKKSFSSVWIVTLVLAVAVVGGAYVAATKKAEEAPAPMVIEQAASEVVEEAQEAVAEETVAEAPDVATEEVQVVEESAPVVEEVVQEQAAVAEEAPVAPVVQEKAVLKLGKLAGTLALQVPDLSERENRLPLEHTCFRQNVSPALAWSGAPRGTESYVVFLEKDPVKKDEEVFLSWAIFNVPADMEGLAADLPKQEDPESPIRYALSDHQTAEYVGPCEPQGQFGYKFRLFALDTELSLNPQPSKDDLIRAMNGHVIDAAEAPFIHYLHF